MHHVLMDTKNAPTEVLFANRSEGAPDPTSVGLTFARTNHEIAAAARAKAKTISESMIARSERLAQMAQSEGGAAVTLDRIMTAVRRSGAACIGRHPVFVHAMSLDVERKVWERLDFVAEHLGQERERMLYLSEAFATGVLRPYDPDQIEDFFRAWHERAVAMKATSARMIQSYAQMGSPYDPEHGRSLPTRMTETERAAQRRMREPTLLEAIERLEGGADELE